MQQILCMLLGILGLLFSYTVSAATPSQLVVFGDSLSDDGNLSSIASLVAPQYVGLNNPPYDHGFSNGPRAVEVLAAQLGLPLNPYFPFYYKLSSVPGTNFAFAGALAYDSRPPATRLPDLGNQVSAFLATFGAADANALYIVFIGGNDVRSARDATSRASAENIIRAGVNAIGSNVRTLLSAGARTIMVVNVSDVGAIPETRLLALSKHQPSLITRTTELAREFNEELAENIRGIKQQSNANYVVEFDQFGLSRFLTKEYLALGFTDSQDGCFSSVTFTFNAGCNNGLNFGEFLYFDEIHPTARTNERIGRAFYSAIPELTH